MTDLTSLSYTALNTRLVDAQHRLAIAERLHERGRITALKQVIARITFRMLEIETRRAA